uniref:Uncharacterized protein n=1 Tax=Anguilla anguilla TaxID=7936 RepID=A0A0E9XRL4_ANGAN
MKLRERAWLAVSKLL